MGIRRVSPILAATSMLLAAWPATRAAAATPTIDNERVTVWDVPLAPGASGPKSPQDADAVVLFLEGGQIRSVDASGKSSTKTRAFGDAVYVPKGSGVIDTLIGGGPAHEIVIALKDHATGALPNTTGFPTAFPRPGLVKVIEDPRFTVWHFSWTPGVPVPMHFHDKAFVVVFRNDSVQRVVAPDGASRINHVKAGDIMFFDRGLTHSEELTTGTQSAVYLELK